MHQRLLSLVAAVCLLGTGCAADAGGGAKGGAAIAGALTAVFEGADPRAAAEERGLQTSAHGVRVDVQTEGLEPDHRARFDLQGVHVHHFSPRYERVSVSVTDAAALRGLAAIEPVRRLAPEYGATTGEE